VFIKFTFNLPEMWVDPLRKLNPAAPGNSFLYGTVSVQRGLYTG
jgi:hypothetical protein